MMTLQFKKKIQEEEHEAPLSFISVQIDYLFIPISLLQPQIDEMKTMNRDSPVSGPRELKIEMVRNMGL